MISRYRMAEVAALIGEPARAAVLASLGDGSRRPAGELARIGGVSAATASRHLARLVEGGLLRVEAEGRHRYFRLADPMVGEVLEALSRLVLPAPGRERASRVPRELREARMCYDHAAGAFGVAFADRLVARRWLRRESGGFGLTPAGTRGFTRLGVDVAALAGGRRPLLRACLDWSERREHLGGALGAACTHAMLERDWLRRVRDSRALLVTRSGRTALAREWGLREWPGAGA